MLLISQNQLLTFTALLTHFEQDVAERQATINQNIPESNELILAFNSLIKKLTDISYSSIDKWGKAYIEVYKFWFQRGDLSVYTKPIVVDYLNIWNSFSTLEKEEAGRYDENRYEFIDIKGFTIDNTETALIKKYRNHIGAFLNINTKYKFTYSKVDVKPIYDLIFRNDEDANDEFIIRVSINPITINVNFFNRSGIENAGILEKAFFDVLVGDA